MNEYGRFLDAYDPETAYLNGDVCVYDGIAYRCDVPNVRGVSPTARTKPYPVWKMLGQEASMVLSLVGNGGGGLPSVTDENNGDILSVAGGKWVPANVPDVEEAVAKLESMEAARVEALAAAQTATNAAQQVQGQVDELSEKIDQRIGIPADDKNVLNCNGAAEQTVSGVTFMPVFANGYLQHILVNGTATARADYDLRTTDLIPAGTYALSGFFDDAGESSWVSGVITEFYRNANGMWFDQNVTNSFATIELSEPTDVVLRIKVLAGTTANNVKVYPMICTSTDYAASNKYVPYGYRETVKSLIDKTNKDIADIAVANGQIAWQSKLNPPYWILYLDCARKYISPENVKQILDMMSAAGFNQIHIHLSDDQGFRLKLDDMIVKTDDGTTYDLSNCVGGTENPGKWYTQADMDGIIAYAQSIGIDVAPTIDMPGHMQYMLYQFPQFVYGESNSLDITNAEAVAFAKAVAKHYARYFCSRGCKFYSVGFDEFANGEGLAEFYTNGNFAYVEKFANELISVVADSGLIPRIFNDTVFYKKDYRHYIDKGAEVLNWANYGDDSSKPTELQVMGYKLINMRSTWYWVLGDPEYHVQVTPEVLDGVDNLLREFYATTTEHNGYGAVLSIWCDRPQVTGENDGGDIVVNSISNLIAAFGRAIERTNGNIGQ